MKIIIPLKQHIGAPTKPIVKENEEVKRGQLIAVPNGLGVNIHSSVHGLVKKVSNENIEIDAFEEQPKDFVKIKQTDSYLDAIKEAGVVGAGGAGFPTHVKLNVSFEGGCVIANATECEPLLGHNIQQIIETPEVIYKGLCYAMEIVNADRGFFGIKSKNKEAISALKRVIKNDNIKIVELPDLYPMGEERAIIKHILGKLLRPDQLPLEANAVVLNVESLSRITEAIELRKPVISKNLTVVGKLNSGIEPKIFMDVPIGSMIRDIIEAAGGIKGEYGEIILGGPFTGLSADIDQSITKTSGGIIVTMPFLNESRKMGLLVCACGGSEKRLREIADKMDAPVVGVEKCKQAMDIKGTLKCEDPGNCPGQAETVLKLKKSGAEVILISNCSDCSNTVMCVAPKLKIPVYHMTDHVLRTVNHPLIRRLK